MKRTFPRFLSLTALAILGLSSATAESKKPLVYVPVLPYEWLFERIGGDWIEVHTIVGEGDDAHDFSPSPKQLARIAKANLLFSGELGFESNFFVKVGDGVNAPKAINLLEGLELLEGGCDLCESEGHGDHEGHEHHREEKTKGHEEEHEHAEHEKADHAEHDHAEHHHDHDHGAGDPHVWLSPKKLSQIAANVADILKQHTSDEANVAIDTNLKALQSELAAIDQELTESLAPAKGQTFYVYHGAFGYFADAYGLEQKAIETTGRRPTPKQLAEIAEHAKEDGVKTIFVQPQFDQSSAKSLAQTIGGRVQSLDPLEKDVLANLRTIASTIQSSR